MDYLSHNIAINLKRIRKAKGMSLDVVAEQTGVSKSMLSTIEKGEANPSIGVLGKIISGLRIELQDLTQPPQEDSYLMDLYNGSTDMEKWEKITVASTIGGMVINQAGVTLAHGMEHPASGLKDIVHGNGLAALTPVIVEASWKGNEAKFERISKLLGGSGAADCAEQIRDLLEKINLSVTLTGLGLTEDDIPWMAENCMKVSAASVANNPVVFTQEEIAKIYREAM